MSREELQSRFHDSLLQAHQLDFVQCVSDKSLQWRVSQNKKKNCSVTDLL